MQGMRQYLPHPKMQIASVRRLFSSTNTCGRSLFTWKRNSFAVYYRHKWGILLSLTLITTAVSYHINLKPIKNDSGAYFLKFCQNRESFQEWRICRGVDQRLI